MHALMNTLRDDARSADPTQPPWAVWVIAATLVLSFVLDSIELFLGPQALEARLGAFCFDLGFFVLLAWGLWRRHPLVHRLYLGLSQVGLVFGPIYLLVMMRLDPAPVSSEVWAWVRMGSVIWIVMSAVYVFGLTRPAARAWFGLQCPRCSSQRVKPGSLTMRRLACKACDHAWDRRELRPIDPTVFE